MKRCIALPISLLLLVVVVACDDDDAADDGDETLSGEDLGIIGVVVESQTDDMVTIEQGNAHQIEFCYDGGRCEGQAATLGSTAGVGGEANTILLSSSDPDRSVVGARISFEVKGDGEAVVTIGTGTVHVDEERSFPMEEFEFDDILEVSETLVDGDIPTIEVGVVD